MDFMILVTKNIHSHKPPWYKTLSTNIICLKDPSTNVTVSTYQDKTKTTMSNLSLDILEGNKIIVT